MPTREPGRTHGTHLSKALFDVLHAKAKANGISVSREIRRRLEESLSADSDAFLEGGRSTSAGPRVVARYKHADVDMTVIASTGSLPMLGIGDWPAVGDALTFSTNTKPPHKDQSG